jgi:hypothetical protein
MTLLEMQTLIHEQEVALASNRQDLISEIYLGMHLVVKLVDDHRVMSLIWVISLEHEVAKLPKKKIWIWNNL